MDLEQQDLWKRGTHGYHTFRIPALAVAPGGTLLAFAEGRQHDGGDAGQIDIVLRRSLDNGRTWEPMRLITSRPGHTRGNPAPVVDHETGQVLLLFTENPAEFDETAICAGTGQRRVWLTQSDDDGAHWTDPVELTEQVKQPDWTWYATGPGHGIQLASGRLLVACDHIVGEHYDRWRDPYHAHVIYSDDHGGSWQLGASLAEGTNESTVAQLADGRVYVNARNHGAKGARMVAYSSDEGASVGSTVRDEALIEPTCQASVVWHESSGRLLFANPASTTRERLTIKTSADHGRTWSTHVCVHEGPAAYSDLAVVPSGPEAGTVLCAYECGDASPYERIRLARVPCDAQPIGG